MPEELENIVRQQRRQMEETNPIIRWANSPSISAHTTNFSGVEPEKLESPRRKSVPLTKEETAVLVDATRNLISQDQSRRQAIALMQERLDNRQREYQSLRQTQTPESIWYSEIPVYVPHIGQRTWEQLKIMYGFNTLCCASCSRVLPENFLFVEGGDLLCAEHVGKRELCFMCHEMRQTVHTETVKTFDGKVIRVCGTCLTLYRACRTCGNPVAEANIQERLCEDHLSNAWQGIPFRKFSATMNWVDSKIGKIMQSTRIFAAEIETMLPSHSKVIQLSKLYHPDGGVTEDSSLRGNYGIELQTPRLAGAKGEEFVYRLSANLKTVGAAPNDSCGMHVHLSAPELLPLNRAEYPTDLLSLWRAYLIFEDVIGSFLPYSRRANRFCMPLSRFFNLSDLATVTTLAEAEKLWYRADNFHTVSDAKSHHHHSSRYLNVNFHPLFADGHMEIRSHAGTQNARKILHWANLHALMIDTALKGGFSNEFLSDAHASSLEERTQMLFERLHLSAGSRRYFTERQNRFSSKFNRE